MPVDVQYSDEGIYVHITGHGVVTDDELLSAMEKLYEDDARTRRQVAALCDYTQVQRADVSSEVIEKVAALNSKAAALVPLGAVVAVVAATPEAYGLGRMWEALAESTGWETKVFYDLAEAEWWVVKQVEGRGSAR